ncbi:MAG: hypothetical protein Q8936_14315 [Bacillota bacterium]|nr:hypothetical protein [Bacillota bacterium]
MKSRYDNTPGKDATMAKTRQSRFEAEHSAKNTFVKKVQSEQSRMAGRHPNLKGEAMEFNAYMCNNGEHAQMLAKEITRGIDNVAFPVDGEGDDS